MTANMHRALALALVPLTACTSIAGSSSAAPSRSQTVGPTTERSAPSATPGATSGDPLRCTARIAIAPVPDVFEGEWAPDSRRIAVSYIRLKPSRENVTGTEEDQRLAVIDVVSGAVRELGQGSEPKWSASGRLLAYWMDDLDLRIAEGATVIARFRPTQPDVRWVGEELLFWQGPEIRAWSAAGVRTVSRVAGADEPRYPSNDAYFSADGALFTITRYASDRTERRLLGTTATGATTPIGTADTRLVEWSPRGHTLLLRSADTVTLRYDDGRSVSAPQSALPGVVHGWTADGLLFFGALTPTVPAGNAYDRFTVWGGDGGRGATATLPNLYGIRAFSPSGVYFAGVSRTGIRSSQLEIYRCGAAWETDLAADGDVRARAQAIASDPLRLVRPTAGAYTSYVQRDHTGIDVAAPYGSLIYAGDDGVVSAVGVHEFGGNYVCVTQPDGIELCTYHNSLPLVRPGDRVVRGQPIALIGMSGITTGPHTHWEAKVDGEIVDPLKY